MSTVIADERRAPVQADRRPTRTASRMGFDGKVAGTIAWDEHEAVWRAYAARYGARQSPLRVAERGGFAYFEAEHLLGRPLTTWRPLPWSVEAAHARTEEGALAGEIRKML